MDNHQLREEIEDFVIAFYAFKEIVVLTENLRRRISHRMLFARFLCNLIWVSFVVFINYPLVISLIMVLGGLFLIWIIFERLLRNFLIKEKRIRGSIRMEKIRTAMASLPVSITREEQNAIIRFLNLIKAGSRTNILKEELEGLLMMPNLGKWEFLQEFQSGLP